MQGVKEVNDALSQLVFEVEFLALCDLLATLDQVACPLINVLQEILSCSLQQQDLVVVVTMVRQIAAFFAHQLVVHRAVSHIVPSVIGAQVELAARARVLLVRLLLRVTWLVCIDLTLHIQVSVSIKLSWNICIAKLLVQLARPLVDSGVSDLASEVITRVCSDPYCATVGRLHDLLAKACSLRL